MCRYARKTYKSHYACFKCRKSFKQPDVYDIIRRIEKDKIYHEPDGKSVRKVGSVFTKSETEAFRHMVSEIENRTIRCPECRSAMADLGKEFKAPKKTAVKEWKIIESLFKTGKCFHTCGCDGIGYIPKNPKDYETYLKKILQGYQKFLAGCQNKPIEDFPDKIEEINYWAGKIQKITAELENNAVKMT